MERDSFVFYRSFFDAIDACPVEHQRNIYRAIASYALFEQEPEIKGIEMAIFSMARPQIDANRKRFSAGSKGGAPKGSRNNPNGRRGKARTNQELTITNQKLTKVSFKQELTETSQELTQELTPEITPEKLVSETGLESVGYTLLTNQEQTVNKPNVNVNVNVNNNKLFNNNLLVEDAAVDAREVDSYQAFLDRFFADNRRGATEQFCKTLHVDETELKRLAYECVNEWRLAEYEMQSFQESVRYLMNHVRRKLAAEQSQIQKRQLHDATGIQFDRTLAQQQRGAEYAKYLHDLLNNPSGPEVP